MNLDWDMPLLPANPNVDTETVCDTKGCDTMLLNSCNNLPMHHAWSIDDFLSDSKGPSQEVHGAILPPRKPGRPKLYDVDDSISEPLDSSSSDLKNQGKKRGRGPKPKYVYSTAQQAAAARRQRNRKAALQSYYKRREHVHTLETQVKELEDEQQHLMELLKGIDSGSIVLEDASETGINAWIAQK
jgi:hypothetical protein